MSAKSPGPDDSLALRLRHRIRESGPLDFEEYMQTALYHPRGGFYASDTPRTGRRGDFFTNVSVGPVFGRLLAAQFVEMWDLLGRPDDFTLVEQGASDGQLLADILAALDRDHPHFQPHALLVEPLLTLRQRQEQTLRPWAGRIDWVPHQDQLTAFTGVFYANELLDAFPVRRFIRDADHWLEQRVALDGDRFVFIEDELPAAAVPAPVRSLPLPPDPPRYHVEFSPSLEPWLHRVAAALQRGWLLLIDYGHPESVRWAPHRAKGTLTAYREHQRQDDPLAQPGNQDLTAHVDFTAVARAGMAAGLQLAGFTDQHHSLTALAMHTFPAMPEERLSSGAAHEMRALRQLLHPESMGTSFKFLAMSRGNDTTPAAFEFARDPHKELFG